MKSLVELNAKFLQYHLKEDGITMEGLRPNLNISAFRSIPVHVPVETLSEAHGISFQCPHCFERGEDHEIVRWSQALDAPDFASPSGRWKISGTSFNDLSMYVETEEKPWLRLTLDCSWNGKVVDGFAHK